jgi:hypothetical protein
LSYLEIKMASSLEVPATCSFFLCVWAVLRLVLGVFCCQDENFPFGWDFIAQK